MKILAVAALAVALLAGGADAATTQSSPSSGTVTVTGTGTATGVPDQAEFDFTVQTKGTTASEALAQNGAATRKVISAVEAAGVPEANVQTQEVSLDPVTSSDGTKIVGYTASDTIDATKLAIGKSGGIVDAAVAAGATDVSGPSLDISDQDSLYASALKAAVAQARSKAQVLADATGHTLGDAATVSEGSASTPLPFSAGTAKSPGATPIEAGTQQIQATVTVTYALD